MENLEHEYESLIQDTFKHLQSTLPNLQKNLRIESCLDGLRHKKKRLNSSNQNMVNSGNSSESQIPLKSRIKSSETPLNPGAKNKTKSPTFSTSTPTSTPTSTSISPDQINTQDPKKEQKEDLKSEKEIDQKQNHTLSNADAKSTKNTDTTKDAKKDNTEKSDRAKGPRNETFSIEKPSSKNTNSSLSKNALNKANINSPSTKASHTFASYTKTLQKIAPYLSILEHAPSDATAIRIKEGYKQKANTPNVPILCGEDAYLPFFRNIALAIDKSITASSIIDSIQLEKEKSWDLFLESKNLKLIITSRQYLNTLKNLHPFYKEIPSEKKYFLGKTPLLVINNIEKILQTPLIKKDLWNKICQMINDTTQA